MDGYKWPSRNFWGEDGNDGFKMKMNRSHSIFHVGVIIFTRDNWDIF